MEKQVASLDLSKKLCDLGVVQESAFYWCQSHFCSEAYYLTTITMPGNSFAAFTVAELGEILPSTVKIERKNAPAHWAVLVMGRPMDWQVSYRNGGEAIYKFDAATEANARAKMLVYLIENKIVSVEEVNARLLS